MSVFACAARSHAPCIVPVPANRYANISLIPRYAALCDGKVVLARTVCGDQRIIGTLRALANRKEHDAGRVAVEPLESLGLCCTCGRNVVYGSSFYGAAHQVGERFCTRPVPMDDDAGGFVDREQRFADVEHARGEIGWCIAPARGAFLHSIWATSAHGISGCSGRADSVRAISA